MDPSVRPSLIERLKRRKVVQWTIAYLSAAWLVLQLVDVIGQQFDWPSALGRGVTVALGVGFVVAVILAWYHGEKGHQRVTRTETLLLGAVVFAGTGLLLGAVGRAPLMGGDAGRDTGGGTIPMDPSAVAVLPLAPATADAALERLGRELAVTVTATLDGVDGFRTVDGLTVLAQSPEGGALPLAEARRLAERLGASRLVRGTLTRQGSGVRADVAIHPSSGGEALARISVAVPDAADLGALTDSVSLELLRRLWHRATPELPSPAALATSSAEALRAYVAGEEALARGEMAAAVASFERAFAQDSAYWFAYWRSLYPRVYELSVADPEVLAAIVEHRDRFPLADRLLVEAQMATRTRTRLELLDRAVRRFPTHWPAWYAYANHLVHATPYVGTDHAAARAALERVVALNPGFGAAWEHLLWIVVAQRDTAATARVMARLEDFARPGGFRYNEDLLNYSRTTAHLAVRGDRYDPAVLAADADHIAGYTGPIPPATFGIGLIIHWLPRGQIQIADAVLERGPDAAMVAGMWRGKAYGWAARGAWDSTAVAVDRWVATDGSDRARLAGYGLMATAAALGAVEPDAAAALRPAVEVEPGAATGGSDAAEGAGAPAYTTDERAELAWLDGVVAWARGDAPGVEAARRMLPADARFRPLLDRSLTALRLRLDGRNDAAMLTLLAAEDSAADHFVPMAMRFTHPHVSTVDRVLLGRWLLDAGRPADALRVLTWYETIFPGTPPMEVVSRSAGVLGIYERARAEDAMGRAADARASYRRFLGLMDRPVPALAPRVEAARERVLALEPRLRG